MASSKRRRPSRRKAGQPGSSILYILLAVTALAAIGALFFLQGKTQTEMAIDQTTLCPVETGPIAMTVVLFDLTDPLSTTQSRQLIQFLEAEISAADVGTLWSLGVVSDNASFWGAHNPMCKPRSGEDVSSLTQNVGLVEDRYVNKFLNPLKETIFAMMAPTSAKQSPIMEALQALVADTPNFLTFSGPRKIIVISDLLQNSDAMSFYRGDTWGSFAQSASFGELAKTLGGAEVQLYTFSRGADEPTDRKAVEDFWLRYFDQQGAQLPTSKKLGGL